jgi:polysaccharide deacetylase family sporulation protein PdaB
MKLSKGIWGFIFLALIAGMKLDNHLIDTAPAIWEVPTSHKAVSLTFDDGPLDKTTPEILNVLREKNVKATFFVVGEQVRRFPTIVFQEIQEGHEVGSHSYTHPRLTGLTKGRMAEELDKTEEAILKAAPKPTLFRPPEGKYNNTLIDLAHDRGYTIILWSIDTRDWTAPSVEDVVNSVLKSVKPGSIILLHDGIYPSPTPEAVGYIIDNLKSRGYEFVTVSELLQYYQPK